MYPNNRSGRREQNNQQRRIILKIWKTTNKEMDKHIDIARITKKRDELSIYE